MKRRVNVEKLYKAYLQRGKIIRMLLLGYFLLSILLIFMICTIHSSKQEIKPEVETQVLQIIPENVDIKELELEEVKLPPLPPILTKS